MTGSAIFSSDNAYRYELWRRWLLGEGICAFLMLNSSKAGATENDPTVTRCVDFAFGWGFQGLGVGNLFGIISTDPRLLKTHQSPVGRENDLHLETIIRAADMVVCAWGMTGRLPAGVRLFGRW